MHVILTRSFQDPDFNSNNTLSIEHIDVDFRATIARAIILSEKIRGGLEIENDLGEIVDLDGVEGNTRTIMAVDFGANREVEERSMDIPENEVQELLSNPNILRNAKLTYTSCM